jgi:crotonobetainyl-CoA:carnitine CoA-transferase CaiB-like acyl-CoA transferase
MILQSAKSNGIRVFDLSRLIFGPFCTQILADMGADVIKVEPHTGDQARRSGTVFVNGESGSCEVDAHAALRYTPRHWQGRYQRRRQHANP